MRLILEALTSVLLFACIPMVVRMIDANPYTIGIFRLAVASTGLAAIMAFRGELRRVAARDLARLAVIGALFFGHWLTLFLAIKASSASIGAIGLSTYGIDLLILGAIFSEHRIRATDVVAVIVAAAGAVLVVPRFGFGNNVFVGMLLSSASAFMYACLPLLHQRWSHIAGTTRALGQFTFALLFFLLFIGKAKWDLGARDWAGLLFLAIGVTLIAHSLWVRVTTRLSPAATSLVYYANIPIAIALGVLVLREPLTPRTIAGAALIIGGSLFGLLRRR